MEGIKNEGLREHAEAFFQTEAGKKVERVFVTSEGFVFPQEKHARAHAVTTDNVVEDFSNPNSIKVVDAEILITDEERLMLLDDNTEYSYQEALRLVQKIGITVPNKKFETLIEALKDFRKKLK